MKLIKQNEESMQWEIHTIINPETALLGFTDRECFMFARWQSENEVDGSMPEAVNCFWSINITGIKT